MCLICLNWLKKSEVEAKKCDGVHYCWGRYEEGSLALCGGVIEGDGSNWIGCSRGHGSCGIRVRKTRPPWNASMDRWGNITVPQPA